MAEAAAAAAKGKDKGAPSGKGLSAADIAAKKEARKQIGVIAPNAAGHTIVPVIWYSQASPGWASEKMVSETISKVGCGLTSAAMILSYFGYTCTPHDLNDHAQRKHVYSPGSG